MTCDTPEGYPPPLTMRQFAEAPLDELQYAYLIDFEEDSYSNCFQPNLVWKFYACNGV